MLIITSIFLLIVIIILAQMRYTQINYYENIKDELDITKEKLKNINNKNIELEKKLTKSNFYLKKIQQIAGIGIWEIYADKNKVPYWSDELYEIFEKDKTKFKPTFKNFQKLFLKEKRKEFSLKYLETLKKKSDLALDFDYVTESEKKLRIELRAFHNYIEFGKYQSTFGIFLDTTQKYKLESMLRDINKDLDNKIKEEVSKNEKQQEKLFKHSRMAQMGEMISMIAHQWRQPLGAISSTSIDLQMQIELNTFDLDENTNNKACQDYFLEELQVVDSLVQNLTNTIDDFRNFYKPNKSKYKGLISEPISKALNIMKVPLNSNGIEIIEDYRSDNSLNYYINELMQVVLNILKNSQDNFNEKKIKNPSIILSTYDTSLSTVINIVDNGGGIKEEVIEKIFDPYFSTKDEKNGTGLGLYMSKIIISEHHNGELYAANYNDGVRFTIELQKDLVL